MSGNRQRTHLRFHSFGSASDAAGLLGLYRLALRQVVGGVLLIFSVIGQGGCLEEEDQNKLRKKIHQNISIQCQLIFTDSLSLRILCFENPKKVHAVKI